MLAILMIFSALNLVQVIDVATAKNNIVTTDINVDLNPEYFAPDSEIFLPNKGIDNKMAVNVELLKPLPPSSTASMKVLGSSMGEYTVDTGLKIRRKIDDMLGSTNMSSKQSQNDAARDLELDEAVFINFSNGQTNLTFEFVQAESEDLNFNYNTQMNSVDSNQYRMDVNLNSGDGKESLGSMQLYFTMQ